LSRSLRGVFLPPKTDRGRRTVGLPPATVALLRRHRKDQLERRVLLGEAWQDFDLVIDRGDGGLSPPTRSPATGIGSCEGSGSRDCDSTTCDTPSQRVSSRPPSIRMSSATLWATRASRSRWTPTNTSCRRCRTRRRRRSRRLSARRSAARWPQDSTTAND
jgi:hypothetical protein